MENQTETVNKVPVELPASGNSSGNFLSKTDGKLKSWYNDIFSEEKITTALDHANQYWDEYVSGADVGVFIGDTWIDDTVSFQYSYTNNKSPVYGYMSENFDAVAKGSRIVQGQFAIAFRETGYIVNILERYAQKTKSAVRAIFPGDTDGKGLNYYEMKLLSEDFTMPDKFGYKNSIHGGYIDPSGFDIVVVYGDMMEVDRGGTVEVLNNCHIVSVSKVCEPTGEPIAEVYNFFGRTMNEYAPRYKWQNGDTAHMTNAVDENGSPIDPEQLALEHAQPLESESEGFEETSDVEYRLGTYNISQ
jgi:hypothetical protein